MVLIQIFNDYGAHVEDKQERAKTWTYERTFIIVIMSFKFKKQRKKTLCQLDDKLLH